MQIFIGTENALNRAYRWHCHFICLFIMINVYSVLVTAANNRKDLYSLLLQNQIWWPKPLCIRWIRHLDSFFLEEVFFLKVIPLTCGNLILFKESEVSCTLTNTVCFTTLNVGGDTTCDLDCSVPSSATGTAAVTQHCLQHFVILVSS